MTTSRDEIVRMARDAGCSVYEGTDIAPVLYRFAYLVAAAEREKNREAMQMALEALLDCDREHGVTYVCEVALLRKALGEKE